MTAVYAVIGNPVAHSLSPELYEAAFAALGTDALMVRLCPPARGGARAVRAAFDAGIAGLAVTIPFKEAAAKACRILSDSASALGAVNSVKTGVRGPIGENTDVIGVEKSLSLLKFDPKGSKCLVGGAGGAARAAVWVLAKGKAKRIDIACRSVARGEKLIEALAAAAPGPEYRVLDLHAGKVRKVLAGADLLVNATPAGMAGVSAAFPLKLSDLNPKAAVLDLVYVPDPTPLVAEARATGRKALGGKAMFLAQAVAQFEFLVGVPAPKKVMAKALDAALARRAS